MTLTILIMWTLFRLAVCLGAYIMLFYLAYVLFRPRGPVVYE